MCTVGGFFGKSNVCVCMCVFFLQFKNCYIEKKIQVGGWKIKNEMKKKLGRARRNPRAY